MKYKTIMVTEDEYEQCYICKRYGQIEWHHVFGGANRINSTKYGLVVPLCHNCHNEPPIGVHFNKGQRLRLQAKTQRIFESIESHEKFMKEFGRDYIEAYKDYLREENEDTEFES